MRRTDERGPVSTHGELRLCEAEGSEGTELPHCLKVYLSPPAGRFGMVFQVEIVAGDYRRWIPATKAGPSPKRLAAQRPAHRLAEPHAVSKRAPGR